MTRRRFIDDPGLPRRLLLLLLVILGTAAATRLLTSILWADGLTYAEVVILALFAITFGWISIAFWTACAGFFVLLGRHLGVTSHGGLAAGHGGPLTQRVALVMPICHEDVDAVGDRVRAVMRSLEATGESRAFDFFLLSDSRKPDIASAEAELWSDLVVDLDAAGRLFYRRRAENQGRKSGNIAEFCCRWGRAYDSFIVLDADSIMSGPTLVRLARLMEANPGAGLIQTVPQPIRSQTLFARIQQFAAWLYSPIFAAGTAYWYPGCGNYWGHNAIIRMSAFLGNCGLPTLPGRAPLGGEILSHDFVEAAFLQRGGFEVWLVDDLGGSYEELPPTLDAYAKRDRRWCQGNLQHGRLLTQKGLSLVSRNHLAQGVLSYLASPLWMILLLLTTVTVAQTDPSDWVYFPEAGTVFPVWPIERAVELIGLFTLTMGMLLLPKLMGLGLALADRSGRRGFGGPLAAIKSVIAEILFAALLAPILMVQQSLSVVLTLAGASVPWQAQQRGGGGAAAAWWLACRQYAGTTLLGLVWAAVAYWLAPELLVWLVPVLLGLVLSIPIAALTGSETIGTRLAGRGWFATPEPGLDPPEGEGPAPVRHPDPPLLETPVVVSR